MHSAGPVRLSTPPINFNGTSLFVVSLRSLVDYNKFSRNVDARQGWLAWYPSLTREMYAPQKIKTAVLLNIEYFFFFRLGSTETAKFIGVNIQRDRLPHSHAVGIHVATLNTTGSNITFVFDDLQYNITMTLLRWNNFTADLHLEATTDY